ncbi:MAG: NB-ARC domain-containing protein [Acidimicrobiales bacterium]
MRASRRVFLSYTTELLQCPAGRSYVTAALQGILRAWYLAQDMVEQSEFEDVTATECSDRVRGCDIFVGLVGFRYGARLPDQPEVSHAEHEYQTARDAGIHRLMFFLDENAVLPLRVGRDSESGDKQDRLRARIANEKDHAGDFDTPEALEGAVLRELTLLGKRSLFMVPPPPDEFVPRPELAERVLRHMLSPNSGPVGLTTALKGAGGFGKTTLAQWLCHQPLVRERFTDALWVELGDNLLTADLLGRVSDLCFLLTHKRETFSNPDDAGMVLGRLLAERPILMVLDDVWSGSDLKPFLEGGPKCTRLITTRQASVLPARTEHVDVDQMSEDESFALLQYGLNSDDRTAFHQLMRLCGHWPVLLKLINAVLRDELRRGARLDDAIGEVTAKLRVQGPGGFDSTEAGLDVRNPENRSQAVSSTMEVGLWQLERRYGAPAAEGYIDLAVFPRDTDIPLDALSHYWKSSASSVVRFCEGFEDLSLIQRFDRHGSTIRLQAVIHDYLRTRWGEQIEEMNERLLVAYREELPAGTDAWYSLPRVHQYMWLNLAFHLAQSQRNEELVRSITDVHYLVTKAFHFGSEAVQADLMEAQRCAPTDRVVVALLTVFRRAAYRLSGFDRAVDLAATLQGWMREPEPLRDHDATLRAMLHPPLLRLEWSQGGAASDDLLGFHKLGVNAVAMDASGETVVSGAADGQVVVWTTTGQRQRTLDHHDGAVNSVGFDASGARVVSGGADGTVRIVDVKSGTERAVLRGHNGAVNSVSFDALGTRVVSGGADGTVRIWDAEGGAELKVIPAHEKWVNAVAFDSSGTRIVSGAFDTLVKIWEAESGEELAVLYGHSRPVNAVAFAGADKRIVSAAGDATVRIWDVEECVELSRIDADDHAVNSLSTDRDFSRLVTGGADGLVRVWEPNSKELLAISRSFGTWIATVACDSSGTTVVSGQADGGVRLFSAIPGGQIVTLEPRGSRVNAVALNPSGTRLASGGDDRRVRLWDREAGNQVIEFETQGSPVNDVAFHPDGMQLAAAGRGVWLWDLESRLFLARFGDEWTMKAIDFDKSGRYLASACSDGTIRIWTADSHEIVRVLHGHAEQVNAARFDASGTMLVTGSADTTVRVWDTESWDQIVSWRCRSWVQSVAFDPSGRMIASGDYGGSVRIWDVESANEIATVEHSGSWVNGVEFDSTGTRIVSCGGDGAVRIWDLTRNRRLAELRLDASAFTCRWARGQRVVVGTGYGLHVLEFVPAPA